MKKSKLIVGILLMIVGIGMSTGSIVFRHYEYGRFGMMNSGQRMVNRRGMMGGYWNGGSHQRPFNVRPNQNQNNGQNSNGGAKQ